MNRAALLVLLAAAVGAVASAQPLAPPPPQRQPKIVKVANPADAVRLALLDLQGVPEGDRPFQRYFYTNDDSREFHAAFNYVLNSSVSHAATLYRPTITANGHLIRCDTRRLWPRQRDYDRLFPIFEELAQIEPYFHTQGEVVTEQKTQVKVPIVPTTKGGATFKLEDRITKVVTKGSDHALHLRGQGDVAPIMALATQTMSQVPVLRADWFLVIASSTNPQENGRYYQFRGFQKSQKDAAGKVSKSAEQLWLESLGIDYTKVKTELRSDQRVGKWRSQVTGKPRSIEYLYAANVRPTIGPIVVTITRDWFTGSINAKRHPIKNLLNYDPDGAEAIGPLPNGMLSFVLFDGKGELTDVAPSTLVSDRTVPAPHPTDLQPPISCWRCHGDTEMWQDTKNDVMAFTKGNLGLDFFDDESDKKLTPEEVLDRLAGLYTGELEEPLRISRNTHAKATFHVTDVLGDGRGMEIKAVARKIAQIYQSYRYDPITPQIACQETGYASTAETAPQLFNMVVPKLPPNRHGVRPENVTIGTLRAWTKDAPLHVNRDDWEQEFSDTMLRVTTEEIRRAKAEKPD